MPELLRFFGEFADDCHDFLNAAAGVVSSLYLTCSRSRSILPAMQNDEAPPLLPTPDAHTPATPSAEPIVRRIAAELDAWQVWEVDSETVDAASADDRALPLIPDLADEVLIVTLPTRRWQVAPGSAVTMPVTVLNNSVHRQTVRTYLEGWLDDRWAVEPYLQAVIAPGERRTLDLTVAPPRQALSLIHISEPTRPY